MSRIFTCFQISTGGTACPATRIDTCLPMFASSISATLDATLSAVITFVARMSLIDVPFPPVTQNIPIVASGSGLTRKRALPAGRSIPLSITPRPFLNSTTRVGFAIASRTSACCAHAGEEKTDARTIAAINRRMFCAPSIVIDDDADDNRCGLRGCNNCVTSRGRVGASIAMQN